MVCQSSELSRQHDNHKLKERQENEKDKRGCVFGHTVELVLPGGAALIRHFVSVFKRAVGRFL